MGFEYIVALNKNHSARSLKEEWLTPPELLNELGPFDLDPCAPMVRPWDMAKKHYTLKDNGLNQPWEGFVWLNPPYGRKTDAWLNRLAHHGNGIALIFARTETEMFFNHVWNKAWALLFLQGRIHYYHANGQRAKANSGAPSVLVAYGDEAESRLASRNVNGIFTNTWRDKLSKQTQE
jgi:hypothetical protein